MVTEWQMNLYQFQSLKINNSPLKIVFLDEKEREQQYARKVY